MIAKLKLSSLAILVFLAGVLFWFGFSFANNFGTDVFPLGLNGASLVNVTEEPPSAEIVKGYNAYYQSQNQDISVLFWQFKDEAVAYQAQEESLDQLKSDYAGMFDKVEWSSSQKVEIGAYQATAATFRAYLAEDFYDFGVMFVAVREYFILVQIIDYTKVPSLVELSSALGVLVNNIPGQPDEQEEEEQEKEAQQIYEELISYKEEFPEAYEQMQREISHIDIKGTKLQMSLEIQASTAGKTAKVSRGDEFEVRLEIENESRDEIELETGIFYAQDFALKEKKYIIILEQDDEFSLVAVDSQAKLQDIEMPGKSKLYIYSKAIPQETGYLDIQGLIYYDEDKEAEISDFILIKQRSCAWSPICL